MHVFPKDIHLNSPCSPRNWFSSKVAPSPSPSIKLTLPLLLDFSMSIPSCSRPLLVSQCLLPPPVLASSMFLDILLVFQSCILPLHFPAGQGSVNPSLCSSPVESWLVTVLYPSLGPLSLKKACPALFRALSPEAFNCNKPLLLEPQKEGLLLLLCLIQGFS